MLYEATQSKAEYVIAPRGVVPCCSSANRAFIPFSIEKGEAKPAELLYETIQNKAECVIVLLVRV